MAIIEIPKWRQESTVLLHVKLKDNGVAVDWSGLQNVKAYMYSDAQRIIAGKCDVEVDGSDDTVLNVTYPATKPQYLGVNSLLVRCKYYGREKSYDVPVGEFVERTAQATGVTVIEDPEVDVEIEVDEVSTSLLDGAIAAALDAAVKAEEAASLVPLQVLEDCVEATENAETATAAANEAAAAASAAGITSVQASVADNEPGTPSVDAALLNKVLSLVFHHLKGAKGDTGATPNISVGTVTTGAPGTPVVITMTGTAAAPVLNITIPQGLKGEKGDQGNTGSSVEFPYELVNNLTTNDPTKGLASAQGVVLDGKISQLNQEVFGSDCDLTQESIMVFDDNGSWYSGGANYRGLFFPVYPGCKVQVKVGVARATISFLTAMGTSGSVQYATLGRQQIANTDTSVHTYETDANTNYIWVSMKEGANNTTPSFVKILSALPDYGQYFIQVPKSQLFNRSAVKTGYCGLDGYVNTSGTGYVYTPKIDVSRYIGRTIFFSAEGAALTAKSFRFITVYNAQGNAEQSLGVNSASLNIPTFTVPQGAASIVITYTNPTSDSSMNKFQAEFDGITAFSAYELVTELDYDLIARNVDYNIKKYGVGSTTDVLLGKKWVACGDSFTHGDFSNAPDNDYTIESGAYAGQYKVYPYLIGNRTGMNIVNEAVNGSPMTYIDGTKTEFSKENGRYTQIPADADYITLKFGINDDSEHLNAPIGTIDDNVNTTYYGAWNIVLNHIITNHPQAKIGIIITNGATLDIVNATIAIAEKWGLPYLNEATDKQCSFMFRSNRTDVVSSVRSLRNSHWYVAETNAHPNALAHEYESTVIEAWLRTL